MTFNYSTLFENPLYLMTYGVLALALVSLWIKRSFLIWGNLFVVALLLGTLCSRLQWPALLFIMLYGGLCFFTFHARNFAIRNVCGIFVFTLSILLWFHKIPGFSNWLIAKGLILSADALPCSIYLNFDKPIIGLFILGFGTLPLLKTKHDWVKMGVQTFPMACLGTLIIIGIALSVGYVKFEPKWNTFFLIWAFENLILSTIAEEVLFRRFLQQGLSQVFKKINGGHGLAILMASLAFGAVHTGGIKYQCLAAIAGILYGWVYYKTTRIEASILTHFLLNSIHIIGFTYPALASSML